MSDRMEGIALLTPWEGAEYLHVLCVRANGDQKPCRIALPVRPAGTPQKKVLTWEYTIHGDMIEVRPSVKIEGGEPLRETFHNEGIWRVKFERFTPSEEMVWVDGVGDHGQRRRFIELNPGDFLV